MTHLTDSAPVARPAPTSAEIRRWRRYLADERSEAALYRDLAARRAGEEREILLGLAEAEARHEDHWCTLLGPHVGHPRRGSLRSRFLGFMARPFGAVFVLALMQRAEARSPCETDVHATDAMAADEQIYEEAGPGVHGPLRAHAQSPAHHTRWVRSGPPKQPRKPLSAHQERGRAARHRTGFRTG